MADEKTYTFRCTVCGFEVTVDTPELPEDYVCPVAVGGKTNVCRRGAPGKTRRPSSYDR